MTISAQSLSTLIKTIRSFAKSGRPFTAEDVRTKASYESFLYPNHMGLAFSIARRVGIISPSGYTTATRIPAHGRVLRTWVAA